MMELHWRKLTESIGRASGSLASICFQRTDNIWEASAWFGDAAPDSPASWRPAEDPPSPLFARAIEQRILLVSPDEGLGLLPAEYAARMSPPPAAAALLSLSAFQGSQLVILLALPATPDRSRLAAILDVAEATASCVNDYRRRFIEQMPEVFLAADMDGIIQDCNQSVAIYGYKKEELIGQHASLLFAPGENIRLRARLSEQPRVERFEAMVKNRAGESITVNIQAMILFEEGIPVQFMATGRDLREERRRDHYRRHQSVGRLISGIAHELNNPLQTVLGNAEMLTEMKLPDAAKRRTERVFTGARRCQEVVDSLLRLKLMPQDAGKKVELPELLDHCVKTVAREFPRLKVQHSLKSDVEMPQVIGQASELEQAFCNVIRNSFQAVAQQEQPRIDLAIKGSEETVQIVIEDNGPGMTSGTLERAFDPFFTTREIGAGKGLGLNIALAIVQEHGGLIELQSISEDTKVLVTLPISGFKPF